MSLTITNKIIHGLSLLESSIELEKNYIILPLTITDGIADGLKIQLRTLGGLWNSSSLIENLKFSLSSELLKDVKIKYNYLIICR